MQPYTDLIALAKDGCPEASGELYKLHHPAIFRYLSFRTGDRQAAEDLTGEVFLKMVQALPGFTGGQAAFRAWLFQIARNLSIDHLRRNKARPTAPLDLEYPSPAPDPAQSLELQFDESALNSALWKLTDDQKDVILMRFIEGMPLAETARVLHKSEDAIKGLQRRALLALRDALTPLE